jgi:hypothetical protein
MYDSFKIETEERRAIADGAVEVFGGETEECIEVVEDSIRPNTTTTEYTYIIYHPPEELADTTFDYYITSRGHLSKGSEYRETIRKSFEQTNRAEVSSLCGSVESNPQFGTRLQQHYLEYIVEQEFDPDTAFCPEQELLDDLPDQRAHRRIPFTIPSIIQTDLCKRCYKSYKSTWGIDETVEMAKTVVHKMTEEKIDSTPDNDQSPTLTDVKEDARDLLVKLNKVKRNKPNEEAIIEINETQRKLEEFTEVRAIEIDEIYDIDDFHPLTDNDR